MIDLDRIANASLRPTPFRWAEIGGLYAPDDAEALARSYPRDHFKTLTARGGEKDYDYDARSLVRHGSGSLTFEADLSDAWRRLGLQLMSREYRDAMSRLTSIDLSAAPLEVNVCHYGPGASLGPHPDLSDKVVTHILYFNREWTLADGGCLQILASRGAGDVVAEVLPLVGNSAVLVRGDDSWHAVSRVAEGCTRSRRSVTVTFYRPGTDSSMWPEGDPTPLHDYEGALEEWETARPSWLAKLRRLFA